MTTFQYRRRSAGTAEASIGCSIFLGLFLLPAFAWLTHIVTCFKDENYLLLIAGALVFPIGILHGLWVWLASIAAMF